MVCKNCGKTILGIGYLFCSDCLIQQHIDNANLLIKQSEIMKNNETERKLYDFKHALANGLGVLKGFEVGYTSKTNEAIVVEFDGQVYVLNIEPSPFNLERSVDYL